MAPLRTSSPAGRRLAELLQQQQEPFLLDVFLLEHGCSKKILCSEATPVCWPAWNAGKGLRRLARQGFQRQRKGILSSLLAVFLRWRAPKASSWYRKVLEKGGHSDKRRIANSADQLSCSAGKVNGDLVKIKVDAHRDQGWECTESARQLSPVSVLELHSDADSPAHGQTIREEDPSTSCLSLHMKVVDIFEELHVSAAAFSKPIRTKREAEEERKTGHELEHRDQSRHETSGSQRAAGLVRCGQVFTRRKQAGEAATTSRLIQSDVSESSKEWRDFHPLVVGIGAEIEDEIFDDLTQDFVSQIEELYCTWKRC